MVNFDFTGDEQSYVVPAGITRVDIQAWGANGAAPDQNTTGFGGYVRARVKIPEGTELKVFVGEAGQGVNGGGGFTKVDGGDGAISTAFDLFGGGAGSFVTLDGAAPITDALVVAGGGGGAGVQQMPSGSVIIVSPLRGGRGGGFKGGDGQRPLQGGHGAEGSTPGAGGAPNGTAGLDGNGGSVAIEILGGGGGGGLGGGGSGGFIQSAESLIAGAGGGGSGGVTACTEGPVINVQYGDVNYNKTDNPNLFTNGNGYVIITPVAPWKSAPRCPPEQFHINVGNNNVREVFRTFNRNQPRLGSGYSSVC